MIFSNPCKNEFSQDIGRFSVFNLPPTTPFGRGGQDPQQIQYIYKKKTLDYQLVFLLFSDAWKLWWGGDSLAMGHTVE